MTTSLIRRVVGLGALGLSGILVAGPVGVTVAAGTSDGTQLVVADPLPGYEHLTGSALDGPIDVGTLLELQGVKSADIPDAFHDLAGQARTWQRGDGSVAVVYVIDCDDQDTADEFLRGAMHGTTKSGGEAFESGLSGTTGYAVVQGTVSFHAVMWRQSKYFVEAFVTAESAERSATDASTLARLQVAFLRDSFDVEPTVDGARAKEAQSGTAYQIGRVVGILIVPAVIALLVIRNQRRKADQRAHEAIFAVPPPPFRAPGPLPPPAPVAQPGTGFAPPHVT